MIDTGSLISTILKHDAKRTSYKIALLRAINDVVFAFPDLRQQTRDIAIPLVTLADFWIAYYWPFVAPDRPIQQGTRANRDGTLRQDMAFRDSLTALRRAWEQLPGSGSSPADGFYLTNEMRVPRKRASYPPEFVELYERARRDIANTIKMPIQYAGPGQWEVFERPQRYDQLGDDVAAIPGTEARDTCLVVPAALWQTFQQVSLWVEALCIHEWCSFTESVEQTDSGVTRGEVYTILTERPGSRLPLTWERNHINLLLDEGETFTCPWTHRPIRQANYHLDHLVPVSVYPFNELWNLVPADPRMNVQKGNRLPEDERLVRAEPHLTRTYRAYAVSPDLAAALNQDAVLRFSALGTKRIILPQDVTRSVVNLMQQITASRNLPQF